MLSAVSVLQEAVFWHNLLIPMHSTCMVSARMLISPATQATSKHYQMLTSVLLALLFQQRQLLAATVQAHQSSQAARVAITWLPTNQLVSVAAFSMLTCAISLTTLLLLASVCQVSTTTMFMIRA